MKCLKLSFLSLVVILLASCSGKEKSNQNLEFEPFSYDYYTEVCEDSTTCDIWHKQTNGILPARIRDNDITALRDSLLRMSGSELNSNREYIPILADNEKITDKRPDENEAQSFANNSLSIVLLNNSVIVWENFYEEYAYGSVHGIYYTTFINYDIAQNRILTLSDLMKKGYEKELTRLIREKLADNPDLLVDNNEINIPSQFHITSTGITFLFAVYEIAPFSAGEIQVEFAPYELEEILSEEGMKIISTSSI